MTYGQLLKELQKLNPEQLGQDLSLATYDGHDFEVQAMQGFVNPRSDLAKVTKYRDETGLNEIDGSILDEGHPYFII